MELPTYTKVWHNDVYEDISASRPELSAANKTVVVTGGAGGIGAATAEAFAAAGARHIYILGRTEKTLQATKKSVEARHPSTKVTVLVADIADRKSVTQAFSTIKLSGPIDIFVSNAAYSPEFVAIKPGDEDDWFRSYEVNVKGVLVAVNQFVQNAAKDAVLINTSSAANHVTPIPGYAAYATSKLAAAKMFDYIQFQYPEIRVYNVQPGIIESTSLATKATADTGISFPQQDTVELPANFFVWIASPEGVFLKGRYVWANWDVKELQAKKSEYEANPALLTLGLLGWPQ